MGSGPVCENDVQFAFSTLNDLAGATWEESISSETQAINEQYQSKIDSQRRKIDRLQEQADPVSESL